MKTWLLSRKVHLKLFSFQPTLHVTIESSSIKRQKEFNSSNVKFIILPQILFGRRTLCIQRSVLSYPRISYLLRNRVDTPHQTYLY